MTGAQLSFPFSRVQVTAELLAREAAAPVTLQFTDNTTTMLAVRRGPAGISVRAHRMFEWVEPDVFRAVASYCRRGRGRHPEISRHVEQNRHLIRPRIPRRFSRPEAVQGRCFDLAAILAGVHAQHFPELPPAAIGWGRASRGRRRIQLAVYSPDNHLIRVNPRLDRPFVPRLVMEFLVYHELCHAWLIAEAKREGRRDGHFHNRRFRELERRFPGYDEVMAWEKLHVGRL